MKNINIIEKPAMVNGVSLTLFAVSFYTEKEARSIIGEFAKEARLSIVFFSCHYGTIIVRVRGDDLENRENFIKKVEKIFKITKKTSLVFTN